MKKILQKTLLNTIPVLLLSISIPEVHAQGFFNQKGAQLKNLKEQLLLLQVYITDIKRGYEMARDGLNTISDIKNGDFKMHGDHFAALSSVSPLIKKYARAADMIRMQMDTRKLQPREGDAYIIAVFSTVIEANKEAVDQLNLLLTPGNYALTDDERIKAIDRLWLDMKDRYAFAVSFAADAKILSLRQLQEKHAVASSRMLYQLK